MDITWNLSFSGLSPLKALIGDGFGGNGSNTKPHRFNETDYEGGDAQDLIRTVRKWNVSEEVIFETEISYTD
jgi:hypothetical protein